jgi:hypothetical protein
MKSINKGLAIGASLVAGSVMALSASSAQAATINFLNGSAGVSGSTTFTFVGSNGLFESDLLLAGGGPVLLSETSPGYIVPIINDFEGTCDICSFTYDFGNTTDSFSLILNSGGNGSVSSSTDAIFEPSGSGILVRFEDRGGDRDFNDFRFTVAPVTTTTTVPEPTTLAGLGLVAGALAFSRRRKSNKAV